MYRRGAVFDLGGRAFYDMSTEAGTVVEGGYDG